MYYTDLPFLQTPNRVLSIEDVPNSPARHIQDDVECPTQERFTLQLLTTDQEVMTGLPWIGRDAAFNKDTNLAKPSGLLLHYNYGAAAVKRWGRQTHLLSATNRRDVPRPSTVVTPEPADPSRKINDRTKAIEQRERQAEANTAGSSKRRRGRPRKRIGGPKERDQHAGNVVVEAVDGSAGWDEDDLMLFFCLNTKAARERRRVADEEFSSRINQWASDVSRS
jgi:hypothetical protein